MKRVIGLTSCLLWLLVSSAWCLAPVPEWPPSGPACSFCQPVDFDADAGTVGWALEQADGSLSSALNGKIVTANFDSFFYVEEPDRSAGIRVNATTALSPGDIVNISFGMLGCTTEGTVRVERYISNPTYSSSSGTQLAPLAMNGFALGGGNLAVDDRTPGISYYLRSVGLTHGDGPYNKGLLIRTWGRISYINSVDNWFYIDDGSGIIDDTSQTQRFGIRVEAPSATGLTVGDYVIVTGINSSFRNDYDRIVVKILARQASDVVDVTTTHSEYVQSLSSPPGTIANPDPEQTSWNLVSVPGVPYWNSSANPTAESVFNTVKPACGPAQQLYTHLFRWDTTPPQDNFSYVPYCDVTNPFYAWFGPIYSDQGYWIKSEHTQNGVNISYQALTGSGCPIGSTDAYIKLPYAATQEDQCGGLTMIGYPFTTAQPYGDLLVTDGSKTLPIADAIANCWLEAEGCWWDNTTATRKSVGLPGSGVDATSLEPWRGYFIRSYKPRLALIIPYPVSNPLHDSTPPVVTITRPSTAEIHRAGTVAVQLAGTATDESGVSWVQVGFAATDDPIESVTTWYTADYNGATSVWTYDWLSPATGRIWVKATDFAGNTGTTLPYSTFKDVTLYTIASGGVIHVTQSGGGTHSGLDWPNAMSSVQTALNTAGAQEVWVAQGTYTGNFALVTDVGLYGGFAGSESFREQRNWTTNVTTLDGDHSGTVVTMPFDASEDTIIDGFTITHGQAYFGAGIYCGSGSPTISNNLITGNGIDSGGRGAGIYCYDSSPLIMDNAIRLNSFLQGEVSYGGGVYCEHCPNVSVVHNVIDHNEAGAGAGVCFCFIEAAGFISYNTIASNDAFTQEGGDWGQGLGGGILTYSSVVSIQNNIISDNWANNLGGGIYALEAVPPDERPVSQTIITNNQIDNNYAQISSCGIYCDTYCLVASNTIVENSSIVQGGSPFAVDLNLWSYSDCSGQAFNNIIAFNHSGGLRANDNVTIQKNDVYENDGPPYAGGVKSDNDIQPVDPGFAEMAVRNYHLQPNSGCVDTGLYAPQPDYIDLDGESRWVPDFDIGADENHDCEWYKLTLSSDEPGLMNQLVTVTANVENCQDENVGDVIVYFSVSDGTITQVNGIPLQPGITVATGKTDSNGNATIKVTRPTAGEVTVTAKVISSCGIGSVTRLIPVGLNVKVGFISDLCVDGSEGIRTYINDFLSHLSTVYPWVDYDTIASADLTTPGILDQFNTIFLAMPMITLSQEQCDGLSDFVDSRRDKRIVLIGNSNPSWADYNGRLNTIADYLGIGSEFAYGGFGYDNGGQACNVEDDHYLMDGVDYVWDYGTSPFPWGWEYYAQPLAYVHEIPAYPWIVAEDTDDAGSWVLIHDCDMLIPAYQAGDKNLRFVYNLCTVFPP